MNEASYLNNTVWATLGFSKIHGIGVIAIRDIPKGTAFTDYDVYGNYENKTPLVYVDEEEFNQILPEIKQLILDKAIMMGRIVFVSPNAVQDLRSWMNHSDNPNVKDFTTTKDIKKGEELFEDYKWFQPWHELTKKHYDFIK